jgi:hypothetical protein
MNQRSEASVLRGQSALAAAAATAAAAPPLCIGDAVEQQRRSGGPFKPPSYRDVVCPAWGELSFSGDGSCKLVIIEAHSHPPSIGAVARGARVLTRVVVADSVERGTSARDAFIALHDVFGHAAAASGLGRPAACS